LIFVILGMHKSGTTLASQILHFSKISMGEFDDSIHYDKGNKYERESSLALDLQILGTESFDVLDLKAKKDLKLTQAIREKIENIVTAASGVHEDWGIKDPRMCLTYQLWAEALPLHKIIVVYREPSQVWPRFKWLGKRKYLSNFNRAYSYLHRWQEHNRNIISFLKNTENEHVIIGYHELMTSEAEFERLRSFVDRPLVDRRKPELYRSKSRRDIFIRFADWLHKKRVGYSTSETMNVLDSLRQDQIG
jgi:hypothetical protein